MPDQVPDDVKHERLERLVEVVQRIAAERNAARVGRRRGGARRRCEPDRSDAAARPHAPQHDGQLRRHGCGRTTSSTCIIDGLDTRRRCAGAGVARRGLTAARRMRTLGTIRETRVRSFARYARSGWWAGVPHGQVSHFARTKSSRSSARRPPASPQVAHALAESPRHRGRLGGRAPGLSRSPILTQPAGASRRVSSRSATSRRRCRSASIAPLAHAEIDDASSAQTGMAVVAGGTGRCTCARRSSTSDIPAASHRRPVRASRRAYDRRSGRGITRGLGELDPRRGGAVHRERPPPRRPGARARRGGASLVPCEDRLWSTHLRRPTLVVGLDVPSDELGAADHRRARDAWCERGVAEEVARGRQVARLGDGSEGTRPRRARDAPARGGAVSGLRCAPGATPRTSASGCGGFQASSSMDADRPTEEVVDAILDVARAR